MLSHLHIRHFAIIDDSELEIGAGMTALTGETGAGKSILLGALGQVLGDRADSLSVQQGQTRAEITASFRLDESAPAREWLLRHELDDADECVLRKTLSAGGKSRATINGTPVALRMLGELGAMLVGIHGQNAHQTLGRAGEQRRLLDAWGASQPAGPARKPGKTGSKPGSTKGSDTHGETSARTSGKEHPKEHPKEKAKEKAKGRGKGRSEGRGKRRGKAVDVAIGRALLEQVSEAHAAWARAEQACRDASDNVALRLQRIDLLRFQLQEFDELDIGAMTIGDIETEHRWLANVERLRTLGSDALDGLDASTHARALKPLEELAGIDERLREALDLVESADIQIREATSLLRTTVSSLEHDEVRLDWLNARLGQLHGLAKKHRVTAPELLDVEQRLRDELDTLDDPEGSLEGLESRRDAALEDYLRLAGELSERRVIAADALAAQVTESLQTLAMEGGTFLIDVTPDTAQRSPHGIDKVGFRVSPNAGVAPAPLGRVASGGELSRIGLALQLATIGAENVPTLIFDEVDAGIGGAVAETVGRLLREVAGQAQVLCVTHLPQVAAQAHSHLRVSKQVVDGQTRTELLPLDDEDTREEIARMLGGTRITRRTRQHAREMLEAVHET